jgi:hypothetical protein
MFLSFSSYVTFQILWQTGTVKDTRGIRGEIFEMNLIECLYALSYLQFLNVIPHHAFHRLSRNKCIL